MMTVYEPPINHIIGGILVLLAIYAALRGMRLIAGGLRDARGLDLIRGIRACVLAVVASVCAVGVLSAQTGFVILAAIILGEELYETGIVATIIRLGERDG